MTVSLITGRLTHANRIKFETEQLEEVDKRLEKLRKSIETEQAAVTRLQDQQTALEAELTDMETEIEGMRDSLKTLEDDAAEKTTAAELVKKSTSKASTAFQKALKDISSWVRRLYLSKSNV